MVELPFAPSRNAVAACWMRRGSNAAATLDSVAAAVRRIVEKTFAADFRSIKKDRQKEEILKDGPAAATLDSVAAAIRRIVEKAFHTGEIACVNKSDMRQREHILKDGPGRAANGRHHHRHPPPIQPEIEYGVGRGEVA